MLCTVCEGRGLWAGRATKALSSLKSTSGAAGELSVDASDRETGLRVDGAWPCGVTSAEVLVAALLSCSRNILQPGLFGPRILRCFIIFLNQDSFPRITAALTHKSGLRSSPPTQQCLLTPMPPRKSQFGSPPWHCASPHAVCSSASGGPCHREVRLQQMLVAEQKEASPQGIQGPVWRVHLGFPGPAGAGCSAWAGGWPGGAQLLHAVP